MKDFNDILYPGSPFLPAATPQNVASIKESIGLHHRPIPVAISFEIAQMAIDLNQYHAIDLSWLTETFQITVEDIDLFMFGYIMAPSLIMGAFIMENFGPKEAFNRLCPFPTDEFLLAINTYKSQHLIDVLLIYKTHKNNPQILFDLVTDHCLSNSFRSNKYYLAGIHASKLTFIEIISLLNMH